MTRAACALSCSLLLPLVGGCGARSTLESQVSEPCVSTSDVELCDGVDNDCDGRVDEDIEPVRCGQYGCEVTVRCEGGVMPSCVPRDPAPESCNLRDDDCDGQVDEGFGFGPLAEAIVLRTDEFDTGPCTSCSWAWGTALAPTHDGFLAMWNLGLSGGNEQPTLYGRPVDRFGNPIGAVGLVRQDFLLELRPMLALEPLPPGGTPLEAEYRVGTSDVPGLLFVDMAGQTETLSPTPGSGPGGVPRTVWTGERFVTAWTQDDELRVAVLAADGSLDHQVDVDPLERPAAITLGVYPGRVGVLVSRYRDNPERRDQWLLLLDAFGEVIAPARQLDVAFTTWQRLVGTEKGWLHIRPNDWDEPSTRQPLDVSGEPLGDAFAFADGRSLGDSGLQDTFVPRPGLGEMAAVWQDPSGGDMHVEFLDSRGDLLRSWSGPLEADPGYEEGYLAKPHLTFVDDRVLVIWVGLADDALPNRVWVRELGCVP